MGGKGRAGDFGAGTYDGSNVTGRATNGEAEQTAAMAAKNRAKMLTRTAIAKIQRNGLHVRQQWEGRLIISRVRCQEAQLSDQSRESTTWCGLEQWQRHPHGSDDHADSCAAGRHGQNNNHDSRCSKQQQHSGSKQAAANSSSKQHSSSKQAAAAACS